MNRALTPIWLPKPIYEPIPYAAMIAGALTPLTDNMLLLAVGTVLCVYGFIIFGNRVKWREGWV